MDAPFKAYRGIEPYVFVCYSHADSAVVYQELQRMREAGINVWYDEGISPGANWRAVIGEALLGASRILFYLSENALASQHCAREIALALDENKEILPVYLEPVTLPADMRLGLSRIQALELKADGSHRDKLFDTLGVPVASELSGTLKRTGWRKWGVTAGVVTLLGLSGFWLAQMEVLDQEAMSLADNLAVLPLVNISGDPGQDYLGVAAAEEIWNELSRQRSLTLIAPTSSRRFRNSLLSAADIGRQLNARYLLEGSVNRQPGFSRISVRLVDAATETTLWSEVYDRDLNTVQAIFALYDDIAAETLSAMAHLQSDSRGEGPPIPETDNLTAYNLLMEAWYIYRESQDFEQILKLADQIIAEDPGWARARVLKSWALRMLTDGERLPFTDGYQRALEEVETAIELAPDYPHARTMRATIRLRQNQDFREAMSVYESVERSGAPTLHWASDMAMVLSLAGRHTRALEVLRRWERVDPMFVEIKLDIALALRYLGEVQQADAKIEEALMLGERNPLAISRASIHFLLTENAAKLTELLATYGDSGILPPWVAPAIDQIEGDPQPMKEWLRSVAVEPNKHRFWRGFYGVGDYEAFLEAFEVAMQDRRHWLQVPWFLQDVPGHWQTLQAWALEDENLTGDRLSVINEHRALIDIITENMVL